MLYQVDTLLIVIFKSHDVLSVGYFLLLFFSDEICKFSRYECLFEFIWVQVHSCNFTLDPVVQSPISANPGLTLNKTYSVKPGLEYN